MKLYLSGKMSGTSEADFVAAFAAEAQVLRGLGHEVIDPAALPNHLNWQECMMRDVPLVASCDGVALLPGSEWKGSGGSLVEAVICAATLFGKPVLQRQGEALLPAAEIPIPPPAYAREIAQVAGAAWLATLQIMSGAWKSGRHGPGDWLKEPKESHLIKAARHAMTDYLKRRGADPNDNVLDAREELTMFLEDTPSALCKTPRAPWLNDGEDHGAQAVCRAAMGYANRINGRS